MTRALLCAGIAFLSALTHASGVEAQPADLILRGGRIITVDGNWKIAQAVAIRDGRFVAVGDTGAMAALTGPGTQVIELAERTVVPGLIDTHLHQMLTGLNSRGVQLLGARSVADVQQAIAARAAQTPPGEWVTASSGWHESILEEGRMVTRWELDKVAPDHPVHSARRPCRHRELESAGARGHHQGYAQSDRRRDRPR